MSGALDGRTVVVTGAGRGIGRGIARACAAAGARVVVAARAENGDEVAAEIRAEGGSALAVTCDVTRRADVEGAVAAAVETFGGLDVMVHNAVGGGSNRPTGLETVSRDDWEPQAAVSLRGAYHCAQASFPHLRVSPGGRLVLLASAAGIEGSANLPLYAALKGAQRGFAKSLAREWGPYGVTVNCVAPVAETPALAGAFAQNPALRARLVGRTPLGRLGDPERDIGAVAVFLASEASGYMTGQTLVVDGGSFMGL